MLLKANEIKGLIWVHRSRLALTYILYTLEMAGSLIRPLLIGNAINDLINKSYEGLVILTIIHLSWLVISYFRHRFDTRTYSAIYTSIMKSLTSKDTQLNNISKLSARSSLTKDLVDFMEYDVYFILEAGYNIFGSLILLAFYQSSLVWLCLAILFPVGIIGMWYGRKMRRLQKSKNDELEKQVDVLSHGNTNLIHDHFIKLQQWQIRISDQEAINFGIMEILVIVVIFFSLIITTDSATSPVLAGDFIGIYYYLIKFLNGLDTIPYALQRWSTLSDIVERLEPKPKNILDILPQLSSAENIAA